MLKLTTYSLAVFLLALTGALAQDKTPSPKLVYPTKLGTVTFDHAVHAQREKNDCKTCHPALFAQDAKAPLEYKTPHRNAEDKKASCGACHRAGGSAFESRGNCGSTKCHVRTAAK